jgi:hypothetical protein
VGGQGAGDPILGYFQTLPVGASNAEKLEPLAQRRLEGGMTEASELAQAVAEVGE